MRAGRASELLADLSAPLIRHGCLTHVERRPAREGRRGSFPEWTDPRLVLHLAERGITAPWIHQEQAARLAHDGQDVVPPPPPPPQIPRLPVPTLTAIGGGRSTQGARRRHLPLAHQGARRGPAHQHRRPRRRRRDPRCARRGLRRGHPHRAAPLGAPPRHGGADQPRHAALRDPPRARAVGALLPRPALRGDRRVPQLPGRVRQPRLDGGAAPAPDRRPLPRRPHLHPRLRHHRESGDLGLAADRPRRRGGHRGRLPARRADDRAVGAGHPHPGRRPRRPGTLG